MSIFGSIWGKIVQHVESAIMPGAAAAPTAQPAVVGAAPTAGAAPQAAPASQPSTAQPATTAQPVDVEAVLSDMAAKKGGGGNWRTSIVDLLKLLDLDSSLSARKELAQELNVHAGADGSAEENIALQKAVMQKMSDNGGKVPDSLKT